MSLLPNPVLTRLAEQLVPVALRQLVELIDVCSGLTDSRRSAPSRW